MKKFFLVLLILIILALIGAGIFLFTFDVNQYRPLITDQLQKSLGKPVKMDKIKFSWRSGISLSLRGLVIGADPEFRTELIRVESANAALNLAPLLNHEVQISSITVNEPKITLVRRSNGSLLGFEKQLPDSAEAKPSKGNSSANTAAALSFLVDQIRIDSGEFIFVDESGPRVTETHINDIDLKIDNAALDQPITIDAKAAFLSGRQNISLKGDVKVSSRGQEPVLENVRASVDLGSIDLNEVARLAPEAAASGLQEISGNLDLETRGRIVLNDKALQNADASLRLQDGKVRVRTLATPVSNITLDAGLQSSLIQIRQASADFAGGNVRVQGQVNLKTPRPLTSLELNLKNISLGALAPEVNDPSAPQLEGILSGGFQGTLSGSTGPEIQRTLGGEGKLTIERGVIRNLNILREVFRKLSMIPGLIDNLRKSLPEDYQEKLNARDTTLQTIELPFLLKEGTLVFNRFEVQTDSFAIQGGGSYNLPSSTLGAQTNLFVEPELSAALIRSVKELEYLTDRKSGALMIPMNIQGRVPQVEVKPDLQYIASRLAVAKTQDVLGSFLKPQTQTVDPATGQPVSQTTSSNQGLSGTETTQGRTKYPKGSQILGALLQSAMQPEADSSDTSGNTNSQRNNSYY